MNWLRIINLGLPRWAWLLAAGFALAVAVAGLNHAFDKSLATASQAGVSGERAAASGEVLKRTEIGNAARQEVQEQLGRAGGDAVYHQCLRANRGTAAICERFLPQRPADHGQRGLSTGAARSGQPPR